MFVVTMLLATDARAAVLRAEYRFGGNLLSSTPGASALVAVNSLGLSGFNSDVVNGRTQTVYSWNGNGSPATEQAGLTLDTTGLVPTNSYSVEMVFKLTQRDLQWRRLMDVQNRQSDDGLYVDPGDHLNVYPVTSSSSAFVNNVYQDLLLAVDAGTVTAYLNGQKYFVGTTTLMNINLNNQGATLGFFLDNLVGGGQGEYSNGSIALLRLFSGSATPTSALSIFQPNTDTVLVSWPWPSIGLSLQYSTNLAVTNWTAYVGAINDKGPTRSVAINPPTPDRFFRLSGP